MLSRPYFIIVLMLLYLVFPQVLASKSDSFEITQVLIEQLLEIESIPESGIARLISDALPEYTFKAAGFPGSEALGTALNATRGKQVDSRSINIHSTLSVSEIIRSVCLPMFQAVGSEPVLTMADAPALLNNGIENFSRSEDRHLIFEIDTGIEETAKPGFSTHLLHPARTGSL